MYTAVMLQRDPQTQRLYLHDAITEKELDIRGTEHLKTHRGSDTTNSELYTADILRNALNVKSEQHSTGRSIDEMAGVDLSNVGQMQERSIPQISGPSGNSGAQRGDASATSIPASGENVNTEKLSTGRSIDEMAGEDADTWRCVGVTQENGLFRRDAGRPTHIKRACGIASQTLLLYMYDAILRRRLTSRRRCRSDRPCCRCSGPDSRRWYSAPPPWARPRPRSRSGALPWCHRRT